MKTKESLMKTARTRLIVFFGFSSPVVAPGPRRAASRSRLFAVRRVWRFVSVVLALGVAFWWGLTLRARAEAHDVAARLATQYGPGCVAVVNTPVAGAILRCRVSAVEVGFVEAMRTGKPGNFALGGILLNPNARAARVAVDVYAHSGERLGTVVATFFPNGGHAGESDRVGYDAPRGGAWPLAFGLRAPRPGE